MLKHLKIKNFKSLKEVDTPLYNLNVLAGLNSSGKSSFLQTLLIIKQTCQNNQYPDSVLYLGNSPDYDLTTVGSAKDVFYQFAVEPYIHIEVSLENRPEPFIWKFEYRSDESDNNFFSASEGSYPDFNRENKEHALFKGKKFQYLKAMRMQPAATYPKGNVKDKNVGKQGEYAVHFLHSFGNTPVEYSHLHHPKAKANTLALHTDAWLGTISPGVKVNTTEIPGANQIILDFQFETESFFTARTAPLNVGFGLSYVLPVILTLLTAEPGKLMIIENPEAHLHPRGQAELGKLIARAAQTGAQIFIETHSDHIINGIRVAAKNNEIIDADKIGVYFFDRISDGASQFSHCELLRIDTNGELSKYPDHFLDEWSNQLINLI